MAMTERALIHTRMARDEAAGMLVRDVMVRRPKTLPAGASVGELREHFANPRVQTALLAEDGRFLGAISPAELPEAADDAEPARAYARLDVPTMAPDTPMADALALLDARGDYRLIVLDGEGEGAALVGLLCLDHGGTSFCTFTPKPAATEAQAP
jgi:predicted transcriptional regulator